MADKTPPPSIGEEDPKEQWRLVSEEYPMPKTRKDVVVAFERILNLDKVQKVTCSYGKPFKVQRYVQGAELPGLPDEILDSDLMDAARNSPIEDFPYVTTDGTSYTNPFEYLFFAFASFSARNLKPRAIIFRNRKDLSEWLKFETKQRDVFGIELVFHKEMPKDAALLLGSKPESVDSLELSLRLELNIPPEAPDAEPQSATPHTEGP